MTPGSDARRWHAAPPLAAGLSALAICAAGFDITPDMPATNLFPLLYYPLLVLSLGTAWWVWRHPRCIGFATVLAFALAFRLLAAAEPPSLSSDVYRYAWDGHVQRAGISPYAHAPGDAALAPLRDAAIYPHINRKQAHTVYPPGAQVLFLALPFGLDAVRLAMIALDLLTIVLLGRLLRDLGQDPARALLYAWSPLAIYEIGNGGHLEAAVLPLLLGAVLAWRAGRWRTVGLLLGGAASLKLYPLLLGSVLAPPRWLRVLGPAAVLLGVVYFAYGLAAGVGVLGFLPQYLGSAEDHNNGLRALFEWTLGPLPAQYRRPLAFALCLVAMVTLMRKAARADVAIEHKIRDLAGIYLVTVPTALHPWYALWLVPWLCIAPHAGWLWLVATVPLSYLKYASPGGVMPAWVMPLEFVPTGVLLAWPMWRRPA